MEVNPSNLMKASDILQVFGNVGNGKRETSPSNQMALILLELQKEKISLEKQISELEGLSPGS
jgi:hypothetical protein